MLISKKIVKFFLPIVSTATITATLFISPNQVYASTGGKTADNAIAWVKSKVGTGIDYDHVYGNQCVDLIKAYYAYLGQTAQRGNGCDYATNSLPYGWARIKGGSPRKGDILVYTGGYGGYGHVAIYESDYSTYHQNFSSHSYVEKVSIKYNGNMGVKYWGVIRPDFMVSSGTSSSKKIGVTSVSINKSSVSLNKGASIKLTATVNPSNASDKSVKWTSSDSSIVQVDSAGNITGKKAGTATITVITNNANKRASCKVTVNNVLNGLVKVSGQWGYYKNNKLDTTYTGMAKNQYGWWYIKNGKIDTSYTGMAKNKYGWFYMKKGKLDTTYTGMAKNQYGWWYIKKGKLDVTYTGMAKNKYGWWYIKKGKLDTTYTGMAKNKYGWWYIKKGKLDFSYTGIAKNQYGLWYMKNGKLASTYNGTVKFNGKRYKITNGKATQL